MTDREGERSEPSGPSSGEQSDPRDSGDDDIPLNIAGHEDRERPDDASSMLGGDDGSEAADGDDAETDAPAVDRPKPPGEEDEDDVQPVEVLVQLAKDDEIEPWDIDIVTVTDKFLDRLDEADLRTSGRALFYASVLLRMKSDAMLNDDEDEEPEPEPWEAAAMGEDTPIDPEADPFASLEKEMDRRLDRKRARGMPQTLDELVRDLREAERDTWWKESREYDTSDSPGTYQRGTQELDYRSGDEFRMDDEPTAADVTGTAHGEDIDAIIDDVYGACLEQWEAGRDEVLYAEIESAGGSRVETFLGLLFLSHRGQVYLQQDDLFGDLWVQDPNAAQGSEEAIAD
ncbi:segregation/condensation protein A [Halorientalis pallida]|uniref:Segregation/condensation protein A n=1 Tax=Halorientalis pallida TaxID=2479928 RepID=A0A498KVR4_9EURY|nr:segregation/condensation protein A [Halorientalis pallida]RXK48608.1 segregation/condensation protein A [Halorientalis pallida]